MRTSLPRAQHDAHDGFSLIEMLVAMAVLSLMMVFLFNLVAQTIRAWEGGSRRVEAAQAARIGLDTLAQELQFALGGSNVGAAPQIDGETRTCYVPFFSTNNATARLGLAPNLLLAPSSGQIFVVAPQASSLNELYELGYVAVYATAANEGEGYATMRGRRYFLLRHAVNGTNTPTAGVGDFYYADAVPNVSWIEEPPRAVWDAVAATRTPTIQNCYSLKFLYASNNNGVLSFGDTWASTDRLPAGVLVTAKVMDEKTAARIAQLQPNGLTAADVVEGSVTTVGRILREGSAEVRRFVPFVNSRP